MSPDREKKWSALAGNINLRLSETMRRGYRWTWRGAGLAHATDRPSSRRYSYRFVLLPLRAHSMPVRRCLSRLCFVETCSQTAGRKIDGDQFRCADKEYLRLARKIFAPGCVYRWWEKNRSPRRWRIDAYPLPGKIFETFFETGDE